jgi:hypothetical protein
MDGRNDDDSSSKSSVGNRVSNDEEGWLEDCGKTKRVSYVCTNKLVRSDLRAIRGVSQFSETAKSEDKQTKTHLFFFF